MGDRELNFFRERVTQSLDSHGVASRFSDSIQSPVPESVRKLLAGNSHLVVESQAIATYLYGQQPGNSPAGLLAVMLGAVDDRRAVAVMKLQKLAGLRVAEVPTPDGQHTLTVEILNELMLTERTRVFKVGLFVEDAADAVAGIVSDEQLGSNAAGGVAAFFMQVLGCVPAESPAVLTKRFYEAVNEFINNDVSDTETRLRYAEALRTELASHVATIAPSTFIQRHIDLVHRDPLEAHLTDKGLPLQAFQKNALGIETRIKRRHLKTENGVIVRANANVFTERVTVEELDGQNAVVIRDAVTEV